MCLLFTRTFKWLLNQVVLRMEIIHGSLFVTFTPGFVDVLANELKNVLQNLSKDITVKMYL